MFNIILANIGMFSNYSTKVDKFDKFDKFGNCGCKTAQPIHLRFIRSPLAGGLLLVRVQLMVVLGRADVHLVLGLRLRRLEGAGEDRDLRVPDLSGGGRSVIAFF